MRTNLARCALTLAAVGALVVPAYSASAGVAGDGARAHDLAGNALRADQLAKIRKATVKYYDVAVAVDHGYLPTDVCVSSPAGVMGYHYVKPALTQRPIALKRPAILVYQPDGDGGRQLVAVEYFKADADQNLATDADRPSLMGRAFDGPMPGHEPGMPMHYDLHAWVWQHNPSGTFATWNPEGSC